VATRSAVLLVEDHRHTVVQFRHLRIWRRGHDGEGADHRFVGPAEALPTGRRTPSAARPVARSRKAVCRPRRPSAHRTRPLGQCSVAQQAESNVGAVSDKTIVMPGHASSVSNKMELTSLRDILVANRANVAKLKEQGHSLDEIIAAKPTAAFDAKWVSS
jgi:hypothetical protein